MSDFEAIVVAVAVTATAIMIALPGKTYRTAKNPVWWLRNLALLLAVLTVGFLLGGALQGDPYPGDPGRSIGAWVGNAMFGVIFLGGAVFMPMGIAYLVGLTLVGWWIAPREQRVVAVLLSPMITSLYWGMAADGRSLATPETLVFMLGMPLAYSLLLTLPRARDNARDVATGATLTNGTSPSA